MQSYIYCVLKFQLIYYEIKWWRVSTMFVILVVHYRCGPAAGFEVAFAAAGFEIAFGFEIGFDAGGLFLMTRADCMGGGIGEDDGRVAFVSGGDIGGSAGGGAASSIAPWSTHFYLLIKILKTEYVYIYVSH